MYWEVLRVPLQSKTTDDGFVLSRWEGVRAEAGSAAQAGKHYVINDDILPELHDYVALPNTAELSDRFRHEWVLRRAFRPFVPQPSTWDNESSTPAACSFIPATRSG